MYALVAGSLLAANQNEVYALPSGLNYVQSSAAMESSVDGTTWAALTGANTVGAICAGNFVRSTTAGNKIMCKTYK